MKIILLKQNLKSGLAAVERAVSENITLPILKNVLIRTFNNRLKIVATNLELGISCLVSGKIIEEGEITVPFSIIYGIINNIDSEKINLETEKNNLLIKTDNYQAVIQGVSSGEFPIIPKIENNQYSIEIDNEIFKKSLLKIIPSVQLSEIRPEISGVLLDFQVTIIKLAATDSFRLSEKTLISRDFKSNFNRGFKIIIPLKTIQELIRVLPDDGKALIYTDPNQIMFSTNELEIVSRLIDGEYPDYEPIIPKELETEIQLSKDYLINALRLVSNFSGKTNDIKLRIEDNKKALKIYSNNQYLGENNYLVPAKIKGGELKETSFNWRYLLDGLKIIDSSELVFGLNGDARPAVLKPVDDTSYFYILMPIKT